MYRKKEKPTGYPKVCIIILNWNGWKDTIECLESLYKITYPNYDVIVVDNGSVDKSIEKIKDYCKGKIKVKSKFFEYDPNNKPIKIIEYERDKAERGGKNEKEIYDLTSNRKLVIIKNEKNYGFAEGNNIGMRYALKVLNPNYILLLNNDTVVDKKFLDELVKIAESDEKIGVAGAKICYYDEPNKIHSMGIRFNLWVGGYHEFGKSEVDKGQFNSVLEVDSVSGTVFFVRRNILKQVGGFDPVYFAYWEERDWCMRIKKMGYTIVCNPKAKIWHHVGHSLSKYSLQRMYFILRNNIIFMRKHSKTMYLPSFLISFILLRAPAFALGVFYNSPTKNPWKIMRMVIKAVKDGVTTQIRIPRYSVKNQK